MTDLITLDEAKAFLRVDHTEEDDLIEQLIATATETALAHADGLDEGDPVPEIVRTSALLHVARLFDGRVGPLFTHFSERQKLSAQDIADLRRLIEEFEDGR